MFKEVTSQPDFPALERKILQMWEEKNTFKKLVELNKGKEQYSFIDGPITANNPMGVHHAWGRTYKDVFQRHRAMHRLEQRYQNGFDCQGLWVEVEVEKQLKLNSKAEILDYGLENFAKACKERVRKYADVQTQQSKRLGQWMDWENSYYTMDDYNIEHIWHFLKVCDEKDLLYLGQRVMPWCLRCGTSLSQHELADSYQDVIHPSLFIKLPVLNRDQEYFLVWTTTPWTLPANTALAVNPALEYIMVEKDGVKYYLASESAEILGEGFTKIKSFPGQELLGLSYQGPFYDLSIQKEVQRTVIPWQDVSGEEGTGIVHIAPGCGAEDFELSKKFKLNVIAPITEDGSYIKGFDYLEAKNAATVKDQILASLEQKGFLFKIEDYHHRYPSCWRCSEDLVFRLEKEWFINADKVRTIMLENAAKVEWKPEHAGKLMADWLNNMGDWCISRKRFWGLPLPFYPCQCGHLNVIGSKKELRAKATESLDNLPELHRPWIDDIKIYCEACGQIAARVVEVGDCWLDAGIVPFSTLQYLNGAAGRQYWNKWFPADFIVEMREQIRLWFYAMLFMSTVLENKNPYRKAMTYEKVHDETGRPMHKSWGNAIWFDEAVEKMGADVMRYIYTSRNPNTNLNFGYSIGNEVKRKLLTLWNTYSFFVTYARLDNFVPDATIPSILEEKATKDMNLLDRWLLARVQQSIVVVDEALFAYDSQTAIRCIDSLIEDTSRWYVRRNRRRFWKGEGDSDKQMAYSTLYYTLLSISKLLAPLLPFLAEELYQNLCQSVLPQQAESVHLNDFPQVWEDKQDEQLIKEMSLIMEACSLAHSARNQGAVKVRQPLQKLELISDKKVLNALSKGLDIIKDEINVKEVLLLEGTEDLFAYKVKPNFASIGKKFGAKVPKIKTSLANYNGKKALEAKENQQDIVLEIDGAELKLTAEDFIVDQQTRPGISLMEGENMVAALDTAITPPLKREGIARDLIRHIQTLRKDSGFDVESRINLCYQTQGLIKESIEEHRDYIASEVLAASFKAQAELKGTFLKEIDFDEGKVIISIEKV